MLKVLTLVHLYWTYISDIIKVLMLKDVLKELILLISNPMDRFRISPTLQNTQIPITGKSEIRDSKQLIVFLHTDPGCNFENIVK